MWQEEFQRQGGRHFQGERFDLHCIQFNRDGHDAITCKLPWDKIEQEINEGKGKTIDKGKGKAPEFAHYVVAN